MHLRGNIPWNLMSVPWHLSWAATCTCLPQIFNCPPPKKKAAGTLKCFILEMSMFDTALN